MESNFVKLFLNNPNSGWPMKLHFRTLENKTQGGSQQNQAFNNNGHSGEEMDPDEVWEEKKVKLFFCKKNLFMSNIFIWCQIAKF